MVLPARLPSIRLRPLVSAEPLWIALRSDWLLVHLAIVVVVVVVVVVEAWPPKLTRRSP